MYRLLTISLVGLLTSMAFVTYAASDEFIVRQLIGSDTTPPSVPMNLTATPVALSQIDLTWSSSTDNFSLAGYQVFRDAVQIATTALTSYSDIGLTPSTTYTYYVTAFDSTNNISASSTAVATTTLASSTPAATTTSQVVPTAGGGAVELHAPGLELVRLEIIPDRDSAVLRYETVGFVRSVIKWGETNSYEMGTIGERSFSRIHEIHILNLKPGTTYQFTIEGENYVGIYGVLTSNNFTTLQPVDVFPPANVQNLRALKDGDDIVLSWENPNDPDFEKIRVLRNENFYPSDTADGWLVYDGDRENVRDRSIAIPGTRQFYTVFTYDKQGNISSGAVVAITISENGVTNIDIVDEEKNNIDLQFLDIHFIQDGIEQVAHDGKVALDGTKPFSIHVPYESVPEHLKTILVTLADSIDEEKSFSFILRINGDKTGYDAHIAPLGTAGTFPIRVSVFDFKTNQVGFVRGSIVSNIAFARSDTTETFFTYTLHQLMRLFKSYIFWFILLLLALLSIGGRFTLHKRHSRVIEQRSDDTG